jgi:hypothetical protein
VVPQGLDVLFPVVLGGDFGALSCLFSWGVYGTLLLGISWGKFVGTLRGSLGCDFPPKFVRKRRSILGFSVF